MHKSRLGDLVIDCEGGDLDAHAAFWASALGRDVEPDPKNPRYRRLIGREGDIGILLQAVEHPSRVHLDMETDDPAKEIARLEGLGARVAQQLHGWTVMEAPSGHRFCVVRPQLPGFASSAKSWDS